MKCCNLIGLKNFAAGTKLGIGLQPDLPFSAEVGLRPTSMKQAVQNQDLADRFCIHITEVLKVFHLWKDVMFNVVTDLISLLDHGLIRKIYPNVSRVNTAHYLHQLNDQFLVWLEVRLNVTIKAMIL